MMESAVRVLLVEDDVHLGVVVRKALTNQGFVVDVELTGPDGLWAATENDYDVVVLDIMLPGLNGYDVLRQLRARQVRTPVLMLTAKDGEGDEVDAFDLGADGYLTKPFSLAVLAARLHALIRRGAGARPAELLVGDLTLDRARGSASRAGEPLRLTAKEFALLEYLMHHCGEVLSKTELLDHVWDSAFEGDVNVVEVYVGYLRRKLDQPGGRRHIETIRGMGYRLS